ncbi:MAG: prepilin peptidase [bacterium]
MFHSAAAWPDVLRPLSAPLAAAKATAAPVPAWIWILLILAGTVATVTDLRSMRIPNWLTLPLLGAGLCFALLTGGLSGFYGALGGAVAAGAMFIVAYAVLGGGAGDAKLMLACGAWLGVDASIILLLAVTIVGFVIAISVVIARGGIRDVPAVIGVGVLKTAGGLLLLRRNVMQGGPKSGAGTSPGSYPGSNPGSNPGSSSRGAASAASVAGPTEPDPTSTPSSGPGTTTGKPHRPRPKGWLPYAPAILGGLICTWIYLGVVQGHVPGR